MRNLLTFDQYRVQQLDEGPQDPGIFKAVFLAGGPGCFGPNSLVETPTGPKKIININIGDEVYTLDHNGNKTISVVDGCHCFDAYDELIEIELENGRKIICSPEHEFRLKNGSFVSACTLTPSDDLVEI